jgi:flagellar biosynthesis/type III secretory pathway chaperone
MAADSYSVSISNEEIAYSILDELSYTLWRQHRLLEVLQFKLEVEQMLLASGNARWLDQATREVEAVLDQIRTEELQRATQLRRVSTVFRLADEPSLSDLVSICSSPWDDIFREHQAMLLTAVAAVEDAATTNRTLLHKGLADTRMFLRSMQGQRGPAGYSRSGETTPPQIAPTIFDSDA